MLSRPPFVSCPEWTCDRRREWNEILCWDIFNIMFFLWIIEYVGRRYATAAAILFIFLWGG